MLALRPSNVAVLGGRVPRLEGARERARAEWGKAPDGGRAAAAAAGGNGGGASGTGPTLYEKARAAAWPGAAAGAGAAAAAAAAAAPPAPLVAAARPPSPPQQQQQQRNQPPPAAAAPAAPPPPRRCPAAVIVLESSDDEDVKMEAPDGGEEQQEQQQQPPSSPSFFPLPAAAGPAPTSWPRRSLSEAAAAATTETEKCLVRGRVVQATSALRFMDPGTGEALAEFGLDVELEESSASGGSGEGSSALVRTPAALSHSLISGLLGGISPQDLVDQYAREGREALMEKLGAVKASFDDFDGLLGVERAATEAKRESEDGTSTTPATATASLVVFGWWEA